MDVSTIQIPSQRTGARSPTYAYVSTDRYVVNLSYEAKHSVTQFNLNTIALNIHDRQEGKSAVYHFSTAALNQLSSKRTEVSITQPALNDPAVVLQGMAHFADHTELETVAVLGADGEITLQPQLSGNRALQGEFVLKQNQKTVLKFSAELKF